MYRVSSKCSYYADELFLENVRLLDELKYSINDVEKRVLKKTLRKALLKDVIDIMHILVKNSEDKVDFFDENGAIDICKWNMYFELAVELKVKILIPRNITIEEYIKRIL